MKSFRKKEKDGAALLYCMLGWQLNGLKNILWLTAVATLTTATKSIPWHFSHLPSSGWDTGCWPRYLTSYVTNVRRCPWQQRHPAAIMNREYKWLPSARKYNLYSMTNSVLLIHTVFFLIFFFTRKATPVNQIVLFLFLWWVKRARKQNFAFLFHDAI